jgi:hypothetical protein
MDGTLLVAVAAGAAAVVADDALACSCCARAAPEKTSRSAPVRINILVRIFILLGYRMNTLPDVG